MKDYVNEINEQFNLNYTEYYGVHIDETMDRVLKKSEENLDESVCVLEESRVNLKQSSLALAYMEIQNLVSAFVYYYGARKEDILLEKFWAGRDDISYVRPGLSCADRDTLVSYYTAVRDRRVKRLEAISKLHPELENKEENIGAGETQTGCVCSPYVVISDDCTTARGLWSMQFFYGEILPDDSRLDDCIYERWAIDFVNEDGLWKIWRIRVYEDLAEDYTSVKPMMDMSSRPPRIGGVSPHGNIEMPMLMPRPGEILPPKALNLPEPYETFDYKLSMVKPIGRVVGKLGTPPQEFMHLPFVPHFDIFTGKPVTVQVEE